MENNKEDMKTPDFNKLNDRLIALAPKGPLIGIRTNLDEQGEKDRQEHRQ